MPVQVFTSAETVLLRADNGLTFAIAKPDALAMVKELFELLKVRSIYQRVRWTPARIDELRHAYVIEGKTAADIAREWGVSRTAIATQLSANGIPAHKPAFGAAARAAKAANRAAAKAAE